MSKKRNAPMTTSPILAAESRRVALMHELLQGHQPSKAFVNAMNLEIQSHIDECRDIPGSGPECLACKRYYAEWSR